MKRWCLAFLVLVTCPTRLLAEHRLTTAFYRNTGTFFGLKDHQLSFLPFRVHLIESIAFPGGGHIANGHLSKAAMSLMTFGLSLGLGLSKVFDSGDERRRADGAMAGGNVYQIINKQGFDASRVYFANQYQYIALLWIAGMTFFDSIFESVVLWNRDEKDDTVWSGGSSIRGFGYSGSSAISGAALNNLQPRVVDPSIRNHSASKTTDSGVPGFTVRVETGRTTQKRLTMDMGFGSSTKLEMDWWFGVPLAAYGIGSNGFSKKFAPAFGFRWLMYDSLHDNASAANMFTNNSKNRFELSSGDFWIGATWKRGLSQRPSWVNGFRDSLAGGLGFYFLTMGTTWKQPTDFDSGTGAGSEGITSQRAGARGFLKNFGVRAWATAQVWRFIGLALEVDWMRARESAAPGFSGASRVSFLETRLNAVARF